MGRMSRHAMRFRSRAPRTSGDRSSYGTPTNTLLPRQGVRSAPQGPPGRLRRASCLAWGIRLASRRSNRVECGRETTHCIIPDRVTAWPAARAHVTPHGWQGIGDNGLPSCREPDTGPPPEFSPHFPQAPGCGRGADGIGYVRHALAPRLHPRRQALRGQTLSLPSSPRHPVRTGCRPRFVPWWEMRAGHGRPCPCGLPEPAMP